MTVMCIILVSVQYIGLFTDLVGDRECTQDDCTSAAVPPRKCNIVIENALQFYLLFNVIIVHTPHGAPHSRQVPSNIFFQFMFIIIIIISIKQI